MSDQHTKEPWSWKNEAGKTQEIYHLYGDLMLECIAYTTTDVYGTDKRLGSPQANARRIVACVNACVGISTEKLEGPGMLVNISDDHNIIKQRDELLALLIQVSRTMSDKVHINIKSKIHSTIARMEVAL